MSKMTSQFFRLINDDIATNCFKTIADFVATGKTTTVIVDFEDTSDRARTLAQNRIYWLWVQVIADKEGKSKDYQHAWLKRNFLAKILCRSDAELVPVFESVKNCEQYMGETEYDEFAINVAKLLSTTKASVSEMTEYLNDIERFYFSEGLALPVPADLTWCRG